MSLRSRPTLDAVVVGAGVVGSAAALALARDGRQVALIEAHEASVWRADPPDLRVYAFAPDNAVLLRDLDVWAAVVRARVQPYRQMEVWDAAGGGRLRFDAATLGRAELGWIIEHGLLVDRLWQAVGAHPAIQRYCPNRLRSLEQTDDGVSLSLDGGERLRARLLIGADGGASTLREQLGIAVDAQDYGQSGLVAFVGTQHPHAETCYQRFLPGGPLALLPFADGSCSIVWSLPQPEAERLVGVDEETFCRELERAIDARLGRITRVGTRRLFPLRRQLAQRYVEGRVVLAGDAAHVVHPLAGQGVNLGLRDVACLRRIAQTSGSDIGAPARLARYARERRSENTLAAYGFEAINRLYSNDALLPTLLRGPLLGLADRLAPVKQLLLRRATGG